MIVSKFFKSASLRRQLVSTIEQRFSVGKEQGGDLYTWGTNTASLGYVVPQTSLAEKAPRRVPEFDGNVVKVSMGPSHTAVITTEGDLYTFGSSSKPVLGHGKPKGSQTTPKKVDFFAEKGIKIKDAICGEAQTIALAENGDVYSWGHGGRESNLLMNIFFPSVGALGHGGVQNKELPTRIEYLKKFGPFKRITGGYHFVYAINEKGDIYNWGRGEYGVFGDGSNKSLKTPHFNDNFERMKVDDNLTVVKLSSANNYSVALMSDGGLYGWGANEFGQMGIKSDIGVEIYETAPFPTPVINDDIKDLKIIDYKLGENIMIVLAEDNKVFWSGLRLAYKPEPLNLKTDKKVKAIGACYGAVAVVLEDNTVLMKNQFLPKKDEDFETGVLTGDNSGFEGGDILQIGGTYRNKYAIVKRK